MRPRLVVLGLVLLLAGTWGLRGALGTPVVASWELNGNSTEIRLNQSPAVAGTLRYERDGGWTKTDAITFSGVAYSASFAAPLAAGAWNLTLELPGNNSNETTLRLSKLLTVAPVATPRPAGSVLSVGLTGIYADSGLPISKNHEITGTITGGGNLTVLKVGVNPGSVPDCAQFTTGTSLTPPTRGFSWTWSVADQIAKGVILPVQKPWAIMAQAGDDLGATVCASVFPVWLRAAGESVPENPLNGTVAKKEAVEPLLVMSSLCRFPAKKEEKGECKITLSRAAEHYVFTADLGANPKDGMPGQDTEQGVKNTPGESRDLEILGKRQLCIRLKSERAEWQGSQVSVVCVDPAAESKRIQASGAAAGVGFGAAGGVGGQEALLKGCEPAAVKSLRTDRGSESIPNWFLGDSAVCTFREPVYLKVTVPGAGGGTGILYNTIANVPNLLPRDANVVGASKASLEPHLKRRDWQINFSVPGTYRMEASTDGVDFETVSQRNWEVIQTGWGGGEWLLLLLFTGFIVYQFFRQVFWRFMWQPRFRVKKWENQGEAFDFDVPGVRELWNRRELGPGLSYGCWGGSRGFVPRVIRKMARNIRVVSVSAEPLSATDKTTINIVAPSHGWILRRWGHTAPMIVEEEQGIPSDRYGEQDISGDFDYYWCVPSRAGAKTMELLKIKYGERNRRSAAVVGAEMAQGAPPTPMEPLSLPPFDSKYDIHAVEKLGPQKPATGKEGYQ